MSSFAGEGGSQARMSALEKLRPISWGLALVDFPIWLRYAYLLYAIAFLLLIFVEIAGQVGMGAQRWIAIGSFQLQPSEMMKISLVLALARYFHGLSYADIGRPQNILLPALMVLAPAGRVLK